MHADFSEFSYGYTVTEELISSSEDSITGAPIFPSLYEEGKTGGGYDVNIPFDGQPLFLQFKLSEYLRRTTAKEYKDGILGVPYYRMHLRPGRHSHQHDLLLALEQSGESVFYIAPEFHTQSDLNFNYANKTIAANSATFAPRDIDELPDDGEHYVAFEPGSDFGYLRSDWKVRINKTRLSQWLSTKVRESVAMPAGSQHEELRELAVKMFDILKEARARSANDRTRKPISLVGLERIVYEQSPVRAVGYLARAGFDCEFLLVKDRITSGKA